MSTLEGARDKGTQPPPEQPAPDKRPADDSSASSIMSVDTAKRPGGVVVELIRPKQVSDPLVSQLMALRRRSCLPAGSPNSVPLQVKANPVVVGWSKGKAERELLAAFYLVPTDSWIRSRTVLIDHGRYKTFTSIAKAKFLNIVDLDCTAAAVESRLTWLFLHEAVGLLRQHAPEGHRVITHTPVSDLQRFCQKLAASTGESAKFFWDTMKLVVDGSPFGTLTALAAALGNLKDMVRQLGTCDLAGLKALHEKHGEALDTFIISLASAFAVELYDPKTGQDLCLASRFHHYHGARLADVVVDPAAEDVASLGAVLYFEYSYHRMAERRERYRALRRTRRGAAST